MIREEFVAETDSPLKWLRVDQIGSLVNPPELLEAFRGFEAGSVTDADLTAVQDRAITSALRMQESLGFPVLSDGEMRRRNFQDSFANSVSGFEVPVAPSYEELLSHITKKPLARAEQDFSASGPAIVTRRSASRRIALKANVPLDEYRFAAAISSKPLKVTLLSADRIVQRFAYESSRDAYPGGREEFLADVVAVSRKMVEDVIAAGCRYIQIDAPGYTAYVDDVSLTRMRERGEDPQQNLAMSMAADNAIIEGFRGVTFGIHLCRGNARTRDPVTGQLAAQYHREGAYDLVAEQLFGTLKHDRWLLEYDSERAGGFEPLRFISKDRLAVLGLVTTKSSELETSDMIRRRLDEAARFISMDRLAISPQCGFGGFGHPTMTQDEQWRKLERLLEVAGAVWRDNVN